jgi:hypothetical protein
MRRARACDRLRLAGRHHCELAQRGNARTAGDRRVDEIDAATR